MSKKDIGVGTGGMLIYLLVGALLALACAAFLAFAGGSAAQGQTSLFVDVVTAGNSAAAVGSVDDCVEVDVGDTVTIDIGVQDVSDLTAWEATLVFDQDVLELQDRDPRLFLASAANSRLTVQSDLEPPTDFHPTGGLFIGAADSNTGAAESGSGILARITLKAIAEGVSTAYLPQLDLDDNGSTDKGPRLLGPGGEGEPIADINGDSYFDGSTTGAMVVVEGSCQTATPPATEPPVSPTVQPSDAGPAASPAASAASGDGAGSSDGDGDGDGTGDPTPTPPPAVRADDGPGGSEDDHAGGGPASGGSSGGGDGSGLSAWAWALIALVAAGAAGAAGVVGWRLLRRDEL
jgi:hypothetical protein